jgi:hypothetical protein
VKKKASEMRKGEKPVKTAFIAFGPEAKKDLSWWRA